jgi:transposase
MVNRRISNDLKECALSLWEKGWDELDICEALGVSRASIYRWRAIFAEFGSIQKPPSPLRGRTRIITRAVLDAIHLIYKEDPDTYLDKMQWWLAVHHDIAISIPALHRNLVEAGLTRKLLHKIARERDEVAREEWRHDIRQSFEEGTGDEFVFVDETSKNDHDTARRHGLAVVGDRAEFVDVFVRGDRYSLAAALTNDGYIGARAVFGSFNSFDFFDFIAEEIVRHSLYLLFFISFSLIVLISLAPADEPMARPTKCSHPR